MKSYRERRAILRDIENRILKEHFALYQILTRINVHITGKNDFKMVAYALPKSIHLNELFFIDKIVDEEGKILFENNDEKRFNTYLEEIIHIGLLQVQRYNHMLHIFEPEIKENPEIKNLIYLCLETERHIIHNLILKKEIDTPIFEDQRDHDILSIIQLLKETGYQDVRQLSFEQIFSIVYQLYKNQKIPFIGNHNIDLATTDEEVSPEYAKEFIKVFSKLLPKGNATAGDYLEVELFYSRALKIKELVKRIVLGRQKSKMTFFRLHKKRKPYEPLRFGKKHEKEKIAVLIDSSGSMLMEIGGKSLLDFAASLIFSTFKNNSKVDVYYGDTSLYAPTDLLSMRRAQGGGGTAMDRLYIELLETKKYKRIIVVTDGFTDFPPPDRMRQNDLFIILSNEKPPKHIPYLNVRLDTLIQ